MAFFFYSNNMKLYKLYKVGKKDPKLNLNT